MKYTFKQQQQLGTTTNLHPRQTPTLRQTPTPDKPPPQKILEFFKTATCSM